jgi:hypothetical protein
MAKILINILFLFVLGATVLPVKQVGKLLHSNQLQEETNDDDAATQDATAVVKFLTKEMVCLHDGHAISFAAQVAISLPNFFQFGHGPLLCPAIDIHCPPPNFSLV